MVAMGKWPTFTKMQKKLSNNGKKRLICAKNCQKMHFLAEKSYSENKKSFIKGKDSP